MASKKQMEAFNKKVEKIVLGLGGVPNPNRKGNWTLKTKASELSVSVHEPEAGRLFSIFCRFEDPKLANETLPENCKVNLNNYSGKWNFHYSDINDCLEIFESSLKVIETATEISGLYDLRIHFSSTLPISERIARAIRDCFNRHKGSLNKELLDKTIKTVGEKNPEYKKVWIDFKKTFDIKTKNGKYINPFYID